jgi:UDP-N-acetylmuramate dehydrogenase
VADETFLMDRFGRRFRRDESLAKHGSLRIGGSAAYWIEVSSLEELSWVRDFAERTGQRIVVVGLGSNVLFGDDGIDGIAVRLVGELAQWVIQPVDDETALVTIGAGTVNAHLVRGLLEEGWIGMEFLVLVPGTFGGAVTMNAGTREKELSSNLRRVELFAPDEPGMVTVLDASQIEISYRHTALPKHSIVTGGTVEVHRGDVNAARERVQADKDRRNETQPYRLASVGSTFANPEGDFAGRLIEAVGLKGHRIGGARISPLHANFFINEGDASAEDFLRLMATASSRAQGFRDRSSTRSPIRRVRRMGATPGHRTGAPRARMLTLHGTGRFAATRAARKQW